MAPAGMSGMSIASFGFTGGMTGRFPVPIMAQFGSWLPPASVG